MKMRLALALIVLTASAAAAQPDIECGRYQLMRDGGDVYRIDTQTGHTWRMMSVGTNRGWVEVVDQAKLNHLAQESALRETGRGKKGIDLLVEEASRSEAP